MTSAPFSSRWLALALLSFGLSHSSCKGPEQAAAVEVIETPSNYYLISYANSFVGALRAGGTAAGAFEIDRQAAVDGLYHLRIEWMENEALKTIDLSYEGRDAELQPVSRRMGDDDEVQKNSNLGRKLSACHKVAGLGARVELGGEQSRPSTELLVDFSTGGVPGRVGHRYVRLSDLAIRREYTEGELDSYDLNFSRDISHEFMGISSMNTRNLMRLGTGSEHQVQRLAKIIDWQDSREYRLNSFRSLVEAVGIKIDDDSNAGYWSPLYNVSLRAGTVFAVRLPTGSAPTGLMYVQESQGDIARILIVGAPLGQGPETAKK
jgi:hypothetical protein